MHRMLLVLPFVLAAAAPAAETRLASCTTVQQQIRDQGAPKVLDRLWSNHRIFTKVVAHAAAAEPCWLDVANSLKSAADAGASEELDEAFSKALAVRPDRILAYLSPRGHFSIDVVCSGSQVGVEGATPAFRAWLKRAHRAVRNAELPAALEPQRKACLREMTRAEREIK